MDALILSCGTGGGHNAAGKAMLEELRRRGHHAEMMNPYTLRSNRLASGIDHTYVSAAQKTPRLFGAVYNVGELYRRLPFKSPVYFVNRRMVSIMQEYLRNHHFDVVFMPHLFPAEILTNMKRQGIPVPKTIFIATDYTCIPFTEETDCDAYVVPTAELAGDFSGRGIPEEKIYPLGIPTHSSFAQNESRNEVKKRLGLDSDKKYILMCGGSMGAGKLEKNVDILQDAIKEDEKLQLIVICGSNHKVYDKLQKRNDANMILMEHTEHMADYLKASHLYITKPGGLSSTEAAVCGIPVFHMTPIPGCETYNARYFSECGMSVSDELSVAGLRAALDLLYDEESRSAMTECQHRVIPADAAAKICDLAEEMCRQSDLKCIS